MEKSFFFNAVVTDGVPDRTYSAEDFAMREACHTSDGVIGADSLKVLGLSSTGVHISDGAACISGYTYLNTSVRYLPVEAGDAEYGRIDTAALKLDLDARSITAVIVKGTPAPEPVPPVLDGTDSVEYLPLADVSVSAGGAPGVEPEDITDRRVLAGHDNVREDMLMLIREYLGELEPVNSYEVAGLRRLIAMITDRGDKNTVLCGDGVYREMPQTVREFAGEYDFPGTYTFDMADFPSVDNMYDIEIQGAGGAGGSHNGTDSRGGGGGGGAYLAVNGVRLTKSHCTVVVGGGGLPVPGGDGGDGGHSAFDGFIAEGGKGGKGGILSIGGAGGKGMFCGEDGADGAPDKSEGEIYPYCGKGGYSKFGEGAQSVYGAVSTHGNDAQAAGAGGSGASSLSGAYDKVGGRGGDGVVRLYRYVSVGGEEADA